jgi:hypothetical protein
MRIRNCGFEVGACECAVAERAGREPRKLPRMPVGEWDHHTVGCERLEPRDRVRREARLALLTVGHDGRAGLLEPRNRVSHRLFVERVEIALRDPPLRSVLDSLDQRAWSRNAADRLSRKRHVRTLPVRRRHVKADPFQRYVRPRERSLIRSQPRLTARRKMARRGDRTLPAGRASSRE